MKYQIPNQSGFSLVETLVAITILLLVIVGPMTISVTTAKSTSFASEQVLAFFLAQEGAELVQKVRDDTLLRRFLPNTASEYLADPWDNLMTDSSGEPESLDNCFDSKGCAIDYELLSSSGYDPDSIACSSVSNCGDLYYDSAEDAGRTRYTHVSAGNKKQPFSRVIKLTRVVGTDAVIKVESIVSWRTGNQRAVQEVKVETYLYDIYGPAT